MITKFLWIVSLVLVLIGVLLIADIIRMAWRDKTKRENSNG